MTTPIGPAHDTGVHGTSGYHEDLPTHSRLRGGSYPLERERDDQPFLPTYRRRRADPGPLGFAALGSGLWAISIIALGTADLSRLQGSTPITLWFCAIAFLVAGIWEFPSGNSFGAAFFICLSGLFASISYILSPWSLLSSSYASGTELSHAISMDIFSWFIVMTLFTFAAHRSSGGLLLTLALLDLFLLFLALYFYHSDHRSLLTAAGAFGIIGAFVSWYLFVSSLLTEHSSKYRLPVLGDLSEKSSTSAA